MLPPGHRWPTSVLNSSSCRPSSQELQRRLSEEIGQLRAFIAAQSSRDGASHNNERSCCELEVREVVVLDPSNLVHELRYGIEKLCTFKVQREGRSTGLEDIWRLEREKSTQLPAGSVMDRTFQDLMRGICLENVS